MPNLSDRLKPYLLAVSILSGTLLLAPAYADSGKPSWQKYLRDSALPKGTLDTFLNPDEYSSAQFDPELGYILGNNMPRDGLDKTRTISTVQANGTRTAFMYTEKTCRINTYGNSFTQCSQTSDGETWQQYLAAHFGEPMRNFGVGGYGVYQAYRRMLKEEKTDHAAEYLVLYIWGDDHIRSLLRARHALIYKVWDNTNGRLFHNNFWPNIEMDLKTGKLVEKDNLLSTPELLYKMTDPDFMYDTLKDDHALRMAAYRDSRIADINPQPLQKLENILGFSPSNIKDKRPPREYVEKLLDKYSFQATKYILVRAKKYAVANNKKLMIVLFDPYRAMKQLIASGMRYDQEIVDFLIEKDFKYFDMNLVHVRDFKSFNLPLNAYMDRYFIGHYNPAGNHFFAYSIKNEFVDWLDPKPLPYRQTDQVPIHFKGYLPD